MIRSDKMRYVTREKFDWFFQLHKYDVEGKLTFPEAWKYFDLGLSAEEAIKIHSNAEHTTK